MGISFAPHGWEAEPGTSGAQVADQWHSHTLGQSFLEIVSSVKWAASPTIPVAEHLPSPAWHCRSASTYPTAADASTWDLMVRRPRGRRGWAAQPKGLAAQLRVPSRAYVVQEQAAPRGQRRDLLPRGVFQGWSVDEVPGQGVPGRTIKRRKGNSHHPRETVPGVLDAAGGSLQWPHPDDPSLTERCPLLASGHLLQGRAFSGMPWLPRVCSPSPSGSEPLTTSSAAFPSELLCQMFCTPSCH